MVIFEYCDCVNIVIVIFVPDYCCLHSSLFFAPSGLELLAVLLQGFIIFENKWAEKKNISLAVKPSCLEEELEAKR